MFFEEDNLQDALNIFLQSIRTFAPREYIVQNFTLERSAEKYLDIFLKF